MDSAVVLEERLALFSAARCCRVAKSLSWITSLALVLLLIPLKSPAFDLADGMINVHGYGEMQIRGLSNNFNDSLDLAQWYNILNVEIEMDLLPDGIGPISSMSAFVRLEARYDCVYTRNCNTIPSADTYGDRGKSLPDYRSNAHRSGWAGGAPDGDTRDYAGVHPLDTPSDVRVRNSTGLNSNGDQHMAPFDSQTFNIGHNESTRRSSVMQFPGLGAVFANRGPDGIWGSRDDPARYVMNRYMDDEFAFESTPGPVHGTGFRAHLVSFGDVEAIGALSDRANPFNPFDYNPILDPVDVEQDLGTYPFMRRPTSATPAGFVPGSQIHGQAGGYGGGYMHYGSDGVDAETLANNGGAFDPAVGWVGWGINPNTNRPYLYNPDGNDYFGYPFPYSPPPGTRAGSGGGCETARGLYIPNAGLRRICDDLGDNDQNFNQADLAWNHGASQEDEQELKEAYLDIELFDGTGWLRAGKQNIVWGKTELFRTTDQFNPQDYAMATIASLEESRIGLWSARYVHSFYDVGPVEDVRVEVALNFDEFEPVDIGRCGEPFVVNIACQKATGLWAHGFTGLGLAGEIRPENPWDSTKGLEGGVRVEFRHGRFSFALTDFYGFDDFPTIKKIFTYERNVDPMTGRPRYGNTRKPCDPDGVTGTPNSSGCLASVDSLTRHHVNLQLANYSCAVDIGRGQQGANLSGDPVSINTMDNLLTDCGLRMANSGYFVNIGIPAPPPRSTSQILGGGRIGGFSANTLATFGQTQATPNIVGALLPRQVQGPDPDAAGPLVFPFPNVFVPLNSNEGGTSSAYNPVTGPTNVNGGMTGSVAAGTAASPHSINDVFTREQQALLGCGEFWQSPTQLADTGYGGADCDVDGMDLINASAAALTQSFFSAYDLPRNANRLSTVGMQPGTVGFYAQYPGFAGLGCTAVNDGGQEVAGCRQMFHTTADVDFWNEIIDDYITAAGGDPAVNQADPNDIWGAGGAIEQYQAYLAANHPESQWDPDVDGAPIYQFGQGETQQNIFRLFADPAFSSIIGRPIVPSFTPNGSQYDPNYAFVSEFAILSHNFELLLVMSSVDLEGQWLDEDGNLYITPPGDWDPTSTTSCSLVARTLCSAVQDFMSSTAVKKPTVKAGGNGNYGRRDFVWHSGSPVILEYEKRNVLGFSMDFAEDNTKSNWSFEFTWMEGVPWTDNAEPDGLTDIDLYNLSVSMDRPTFINFLNANRTFFFNSQWFFQYVDGYEDSFTANGPLNVLATFTLQTGYFQDRLTPTMTFLYDFTSGSGGFLPSFLYRFNDAFSAEFGMNWFFGEWQSKEMPISVLQPLNRTGRYRDKVFVENGVSAVRDHDEIYLRLRYTF